MSNVGCWGQWSSEDWRLLDRDGLVEILAQTCWYQRTDELGRNVFMAGLVHGCAPQMFDQLVGHAISDERIPALMSHEDAAGVKVPAYALRFAARMKTASSALWKDHVFAPSRGVRNHAGQGLLWQMARLAANTRHPDTWFPEASPLPVEGLRHPALVMTPDDWMAGMGELEVDGYIARRLLVHAPGMPRQHACDLDALDDWLLPLYRFAQHSCGLGGWPAALLRLCRVADGLLRMISDAMVSPLPPTQAQALVVELFDGLQPDLRALWPLATHPDRHMVRWLMGENRLGAHWDALVLALETVETDMVGGQRRL